jgi:penicillin-binding protein 1A
MVGGPDFADSQYNIATSADGRQTGSTFKVITLATALENGYSPNDLVDESSPCSVKGYGGEAVNDEPGGGVSDVLSATAGSVNCAFVRIATSVGYDKVIAMAHAMGITKNNLDPILNLTLGTREQNPQTMAAVMATIASGGVYHAPYVVQKVVGPDGRILIDETGTGNRVLDSDVAACEQNVLRHVVVGPEAHTGANADVPGQNIFGKTGTTDQRADAWFIGATPQLATAVWFGNRTGNVQGAGFGGDSAAPIFKSFMEAALAGQPATPLPDPGPVCAREGETVNADGGRDPNSTFANPSPAPTPQIQLLPTPTPTVQTTPRPTIPTVPGKP